MGLVDATGFLQLLASVGRWENTQSPSLVSSGMCLLSLYRVSAQGHPGIAPVWRPKVGPNSAQTLSGTLEAPQTWASSPTPRRLTLLCDRAAPQAGAGAASGGGPC